MDSRNKVHFCRNWLIFKIITVRYIFKLTLLRFEKKFSQNFMVIVCHNYPVSMTLHVLHSPLL